MKERLKRVYAALKERKKKLLTLIVFIIVFANSTGLALADDGSWTDKITDSIKGIFDAIFGGIKKIFEMIVNAILWPFRQFDAGMFYTWVWSKEKFGPLAIIITLLIGGAAIYIILFWVETYIQQLTNN